MQTVISVCNCEHWYIRSDVGNLREQGKGIHCRIISRGGQCVSNAGSMMDVKKGSELQGNGGGGQCISNIGKLTIQEKVQTVGKCKVGLHCPEPPTHQKGSLAIQTLATRTSVSVVFSQQAFVFYNC